MQASTPDVCMLHASPSHLTAQHVCVSFLCACVWTPVRRVSHAATWPQVKKQGAKGTNTKGFGSGGEDAYFYCQPR